MGIRGLTGFIDKNQHLLHQYELQNCSVVLDGNNFYHYLYHACHLQCNFGGDYDVYRTKIIATFQSMKECGITPYVVLDGAYTVDGRKLKTSLSRAVTRINLVESIANGHSGQVLPALAYETFIQVITESGIPHAMCQFEADSEIATLANKLQCPVISNDSDFYIFDLRYGFLPLDYVHFRPVRKQSTENKTHSYIHCYKYHVDDFISSFEGLNRSTLPIFATLLGNDYIDNRAFSVFYARFKVPKVVSKEFSLPSRMTKIISVLHWLHTQADTSGITQVRDQLLTYFSADKRTVVGKLFDKAVQGYTEINTFDGFDLFKFFANERPAFLNVSPDFNFYNGRRFPEWFLSSVCKGELTSHILNVAVLHRVILLTQVEALPFASSYNTSSFLRNILYAIVLKDEICDPTRTALNLLTISSHGSPAYNTRCNSFCERRYELCGKIEGENTDTEEKNGDQIKNDFEEYERDSCDQDDPFEMEQITNLEKLRPNAACVEEYTRVNNQLKKTAFYVSSEAEKFQPPGLEELPCLSFEQREEVIFKAFNVCSDSVTNFPDKMKIFVLCVIAWISRSNPNVTFHQFDSILLCVLFLAAKRDLKTRKRKQKRCDKESYSHEEYHLREMPHKSVQTNFDIEYVCSLCQTSDLKEFTFNLKKYHKTEPTFNRNNCFSTTICHAFAQLQALLVDASHLNRILMKPLLNPQPSEFINGTFLYNLTADISGRSNPDLFVSLMFGESNSTSLLKDLYQNLRSFFLEETKLSDFLIISKQTRNRHGRKKKNKKSQFNTQAKDVNSEQEDEVLDTDEFSEFSDNNKFNLLMLCD
ncbi:protein asteroid homolog 1-like [Plakobranchus ocellatus]|uniref:Protein asteroid homolog 1-like n=1 Tax=Plakobranchus ocellatus TaxID=259542 RepID=A0AAV4DST2_9GAST|nr:protein asteroid homolog 1-like [Plakobranchus ocellatus]